MADSLSAPVLEATLARVRGRERRRARDASIRRTLIAVALAVLVLCAARVFDLVMGRPPLPVTWALACVALVAAVGAGFVVRGVVGRSDAEISRDLDRRLGLDDRASAALAVLRGAAGSRLAGFLVDDAESAIAGVASRVDVVFPEKPERRVTWLVRWLARAAVVAIVLTVIAELLRVGGPIRILPGLSVGGGEPQALVPPTKDAPHRDGDEPGGGASAPKESGEPKEPKTKPVEPGVEHGAIRASMKMTKDSFASTEPVTATVSAAATGEIGRPRTFDLRVSVDGVECDTGTQMTVDPARPQGDRAEIDLKHVPGLKLEPGEHVAIARLTSRTSHEEHASAPVKFRVEPPPKDENDDRNQGGSPPPPKPKPKPQPQGQPPQPQPGDPKKKDDQPGGPAEPPPPPAALDKKVVVPLFGDGETVKKKGLVLVLDPSGGNRTPPERRPLDETLPAAKRRAEETVDRAKLSDADRDLVRRYFELLGELRR